LEARLVAVAKTAPLLARVNNLKQDLSYDRLTDGEAANLEDFIGLLSIIMPAIGCPLFAFPNSIHLGSVSIDHHIESSTGKAGTYFELVKGAARGIAYLRDGAFWVSKGSTARVEEYSSLRDGYRKTRAALVECGILVCDHHRGLLVFTQDVPFNSPSDAAAVIGTTSLNGRKEWKVLGKGISYSDWDAAQISNSK